MTPEGIDHRHLGGDLLKRVSRSFYLSMRFLPKPMREPISLGYLLARASDTLADTAAVPVDTRRRCMERFRGSIPHTQPDFPEFYAEVIRDFTPAQSHEGERELLQRLPDLFAWLMDRPAEDRGLLIQVLEEIARGQSWDLERFGGETREGGSVSCCENASDLETYAYRVAGSVGEFWTRVGWAKLGADYASGPEDIDGLVDDGIAMGRALQLVNILRDLPEDLGNGRCYLPSDELREAGWNGEGLPGNEALLVVTEAWRARCREWLAQGWRYATRLGNRRVRFATVLPLLLAEDTLDRLEEAGERVLRERIKVSRAEVRKAMLRALRFAFIPTPQKAEGRG